MHIDQRSSKWEINNGYKGRLIKLQNLEQKQVNSLFTLKHQNGMQHLPMNPNHPQLPCTCLPVHSHPWPLLGSHRFQEIVNTLWDVASEPDRAS